MRVVLAGRFPYLPLGRFLQRPSHRFEEAYGHPFLGPVGNGLLPFGAVLQNPELYPNVGDGMR